MTVCHLGNIAIRFFPNQTMTWDPQTERFTEFKSLAYKTARGTGMTYGAAGDRDGNGWWTQMAFDIIALVQKNFLDARYDSNVSVIEEAIRILDARAKPQSKEVDAALEELSKLDAERRRSLPSALVVPSPSPGRAPGGYPSSPRTPPFSAPSPAGSTDATAAGDAAAQLEDRQRRKLRPGANIDLQRANALLRRPRDQLGQRLRAQRGGENAYVHNQFLF